MMSDRFFQIITEFYPLIAALISMLTAQILKTVIFYLKSFDLNVKHLFSTGGMPSSHSAMVSALSASIGLQEGWSSSLFCLSTVFSIIVAYDAMGIRRAAGKQAKLLNQMVEDLFEHGEIESEKLTELLGHNPLEIFAGICLGVGIAFSLYY